MEEPIFIKCEPGSAELNNSDPDIKLPTEEQVKTEPEDVYDKTSMEEEIEIQDVKIEICDEENDASGISLNETLAACPEVPQTTLSDIQKKYKSQCNICKKWFRCSSALKKHVVIHSGDKPYKCNRCEGEFAHESTWRNHQVVHSQEKNHICVICDRRFSLRATLKRHLVTHSKRKIRYMLIRNDLYQHAFTG